MFIICAEQFQILTVDNFGLDIWTDRRTNMYHIANVTAISSLTKIAFQKCFKATSKYLFPEHYLCTLFYSKLHVFYLHRNVHQLLTNFQSVIYVIKMVPVVPLALNIKREILALSEELR